MKRRHRRPLSVLAFGLLALAVELAGRSLTHRLDVGQHVDRPGYASGGYYPFLLIAVKAGIALLLARLAWRFAKACATARAARRLAAAVGVRPRQVAPRVRIELSPRLWLASFAVTAGIYLVQADAEALAGGSFTGFGPWLHTSALPVFAVLSVAAAVLWRGVARWLAEYESYAEATDAYVRSLVGARELHLRPSRPRSDAVPPRRLHGLAFESRPPPAPV